MVSNICEKTKKGRRKFQGTVVKYLEKELLSNASALQACLCCLTDGGHLQLPGNPGDEHLSRAPGTRAACRVLFIFISFFSDLSQVPYVEMCRRPPAGCHRHGQDHLLSAAADAGSAGSHGQPHQLRPVSSLQQLHLRVSIVAQPPVSAPTPRPRLSVLPLCLRQGAEASWPTLTALDRVLASWQPHFGVFSSSAAKCIFLFF